MRKPLTGLLTIRIHAVKDVDHATTSRFARGPETTVAVKVEDNVVAKTKPTRTDRWDNEFHNLNVEKANEIELTVYDKPSDHPLPIGLLWIRISDIVEEMRRKKIEAEINSSGWVSADRMASGSIGGAPPAQFNMNPQQPPPQFGGPPGSAGQGAPNPMGAAPVIPPSPIDAWFALEPTGAVHLTISFQKQAKNSRPFDVGLNRKGAIRQRKEEVHEMYGHKFVQQQFYNIMRCALCGDFLKYSAGMQCEDCKYTCHTKCYPSVVTKCISKSNAETDPDEEKINHRIPHRFEKFSNMSANWCCHCGYILPFGKKNCRKCSGRSSGIVSEMRSFELMFLRMWSYLPRTMCAPSSGFLRHVDGSCKCHSRWYSKSEASADCSNSYDWADSSTTIWKANFSSGTNPTCRSSFFLWASGRHSTS
ncbi:hypothetical protein BGZ60DRAFT_255054 [Tricladium varicosporioides]|nr:hypothetical protein BGZ60DRAFT_255054 [Hymenoscyphus varicosporioides]